MPDWKPVPQPGTATDSISVTAIPVSTASVTTSEADRLYGPLTDPTNPLGGRNGYSIPRPGEPEYGAGDHGR